MEHGSERGDSDSLIALNKELARSLADLKVDYAKLREEYDNANCELVKKTMENSKLKTHNEEIHKELQIHIRQLVQSTVSLTKIARIGNESKKFENKGNGDSVYVFKPLRRSNNQFSDYAKETVEDVHKNQESEDYAEEMVEDLNENQESEDYAEETVEDEESEASIEDRDRMSVVLEDDEEETSFGKEEEGNQINNTGPLVVMKEAKVMLTRMNGLNIDNVATRRGVKSKCSYSPEQDVPVTKRTRRPSVYQKQMSTSYSSDEEERVNVNTDSRIKIGKRVRRPSVRLLSDDFVYNKTNSVPNFDSVTKRIPNIKPKASSLDTGRSEKENLTPSSIKRARRASVNCGYLTPAKTTKKERRSSIAARPVTPKKTILEDDDSDFQPAKYSYNFITKRSYETRDRDVKHSPVSTRSSPPIEYDQEDSDEDYCPKRQLSKRNKCKGSLKEPSVKKKMRR